MTTPCIPPLIGQFLSLVNQARVDHGLIPLRIAPTLQQAATVKATVIANGRPDQFSHTEPSGRTPSQLALDYGYPEGGWVGENILWGYGTVEAAFQAWWDSPAHRENILGSAYTMTGIALNVEPIWDGPGDVYAVGVQLFGTMRTDHLVTCGQEPPFEEPKSPTPKPRPPKTPPPVRLERARRKQQRKMLRRIMRLLGME